MEEALLFQTSTQDEQAQINKIIKSFDVVMFSKSWCPFCTKAKKLFEKGGVQCKSIEMDLMANGHKLHEALKQVSGQETVPNIYVGGRYIGGYDDMLAKI